MKLIEFHANPKDNPKKEDVFEDIGKPSERFKGNPAGVFSDMQMDPTLVLLCPVCDETRVYKAPAGWWRLWAFGLEGPEQLERNLQWMLDASGEYHCPQCGVPSRLGDDSKTGLCDIVKQAVGNMPAEGAVWARQCFDRFMAFHNWGHPAYQYRNEPDCDRSITANTWLETVCGTCKFCVEALQRSQQAWAGRQGR